jgi:translation initiation factor IF-3
LLLFPPGKQWRDRLLTSRPHGLGGSTEEVGTDDAPLPGSGFSNFKGGQYESDKHLRPRRGPFEAPRRPEPSARINDAIRVPKVRLIGEAGQQLGIKTTAEARTYADGKGLDLVEVAATADPPVAKVMDYGKYRYELEQKAKQARKNQTQIHVKEIKLRPKIGIHDYETKKGHVARFLNQRAKVKVTIMFRGREREHPDRGRDLLMRLADDVKEIGVIELQPLLEGRNMTMVLAPTKNAGVKKDAEDENELGSEEEVQGDGNGEAPPAPGEPESQSRAQVVKDEAGVQ